MRTTSCRSLLSGLAFIALLAGVISSPAQDVTLLHMTNTTWRYYQGTTNPPNVSGLDWKAVNYNHGAWSGPAPGAFGVEDDAVVPINTRLNLTQPGASAQTLTYYFRTTFNFSGSTAGVNLIFTNILDDGAVVYLNGNEIYRIRMPAGVPAYNTSAQGRPAGLPEGALELTNVVNSPHLRVGNNVIAVEVHQSGTASSDVVFGLALFAERLDPIVITNQPQSQVLAVGDDLELSVGVTGSFPVYQWFRNGVAIAGQTGPTYSLGAITTTAAGNYHVVVSNAISRVTSDTAVITVIPDTFQPIPLTAIVEENDTNRVEITFDDRIPNTSVIPNEPFRGAANESNWVVRIVGEPNTVITTLTSSANQRRVRLTVSPNWDRTKQYYVTIKNITDDNGNIVRWHEQIGVNFRVSTNVVPHNAGWKWTAMFESNLPPAWTTSNYVEDPNLWVDGVSPMYYEPDFGGPDTCMGAIYNGSGNGSGLPVGYNSYYFRHKFTVPASTLLQETTLRLTNVLDDGAIFYMNGVEFFRTNMPTGPVSFNTVASGAREPTNCIAAINFPGSLLVHGVNVIAVQLHQGPDDGSGTLDVAMGLKLDLATTVGFDIPRINFSRTTNRPPRLVLSWPGTGWTLQQTSTPQNTNSWTTATATGNSFTNTTAGRFFRLRRQ